MISILRSNTIDRDQLLVFIFTWLVINNDILITSMFGLKFSLIISIFKSLKINQQTIVDSLLFCESLITGQNSEFNNSIVMLMVKL